MKDDSVMKELITQLRTINNAAMEFAQQVVVISSFLDKGDANTKMQRYYAEQLSKALDNFSIVMWPAEDDDNG